MTFGIKLELLLNSKDWRGSELSAEAKQYLGDVLFYSLLMSSSFPKNRQQIIYFQIETFAKDSKVCYFYYFFFTFWILIGWQISRCRKFNVPDLVPKSPCHRFLIEIFSHILETNSRRSDKTGSIRRSLRLRVFSFQIFIGFEGLAWKWAQCWSKTISPRRTVLFIVDEFVPKKSTANHKILDRNAFKGWNSLCFYFFFAFGILIGYQISRCWKFNVPDLVPMLSFSKELYFLTF